MNQFDGIFFQNGRLESEFVEQEMPIGGGGFGIVTKAKHLIDDKDYAIKKIRIKSKTDLDETIRERKIWAKLDCDYFVQYRSSWVELANDRVLEQFNRFNWFSEDSADKSNRNSNSSGKSKSHQVKYAVLHIQMDLCSFTLRVAVDLLKDYFECKKEQLPPLGYYIASELLLEILTYIKYLHKHKPTILHRDINPNNILIKVGTNARFIKIADFGGAVEHAEEQTHTKMSGTIKYMAPEVMTSSRYDTKADIYSIGVMTQELFNFDINVNSQQFSGKYDKIKEITGKAMNGQRRVRPTCAQWLDERSQWALDYSEIRDEIINRIDSKKIYNLKTEFILYFLQTKYKYNENIV